MKIDIKQSTVVRPSKATPKHFLWISNLDLIVPRDHLNTVYFYKADGSNNFFKSDVLREALSNILVPYYPVAGRLIQGDNGRCEVDCNGEGVLFIEAQSESAMEDAGCDAPTPHHPHLVPIVDFSSDTSSQPLLLLQVTSFKCGGVSLGVAWHHTLADGTSALHFINAWADMARGNNLTNPPFLDRTLIRPRDPPSPAYDHIEYHASPPMKDPSRIPKTSSISILSVSCDQLSSLKAKTRDENDTVRYSSYEALAAHVWRCVCMARGLEADQVTKLFIPTDGRHRFCPPLPNGFFGNVLFSATPISTSGEITSKSLMSTAKTIRNALMKMNDDYVRSAVDYLELNDPMSLVRGAHTFRCPNLNIVSWMRLPIYDADFGWGRPIYMGPSEVMFEGLAFILPSPTKSGSFSVVIRLEPNHLKQFEKLFYKLMAI